MCDQCKQAQAAWDWDGYKEDCLECTVRALAKSSYSDRDRFYEQHLSHTGTAGFSLLKDAVARERKRIEALKMAEPQRWWQRQA